MHMIKAEKVENLDIKGLSCRPARRGIGLRQAVHRLAGHVILSLIPLSGRGNDMQVDPSG
jgi:hypothetical protein